MAAKSRRKTTSRGTGLVRLGAQARRDLRLTSCARSLGLISVGADHETPTERSAAWPASAGTGLAINVDLDDRPETITVRLVVGPLTEAEAHAWTERHVDVLHLPDGRLALTSGLDWVLAARSPRAAESTDCRHVRVPPGSYRVEVHPRFPGQEELDGPSLLVRLASLSKAAAKKASFPIPRDGRHRKGLGERPDRDELLARLQGSADLSELELIDVDLTGAELTDRSLGRLVRVQLDGAKLAGTSFQRLEDCRLRRADLTGARLSPAVVTPETDVATVSRSSRAFWPCSITADFTGSNLREARLRAARVTACGMKRVRLDDADLEWAELFDVDLERASLRRANLNFVKLERVSLKGADLRDAQLIGAHLDKVDLSRADLRGAQLRAIQLTDVSLDGADLTDALVDRDLVAETSGRRRRKGRPTASPTKGPHLERLDRLVTDCRSLRSSAELDVAGGVTVQLVRDRRLDVRQVYGTWCHRGHPTALSENSASDVLLRLAELWPPESLRPETLSCSCEGVRIKKETLQAVVQAAWRQAFGLEVPKVVVTKARQR
ncbi:MAG: pentapeptide repeat-containing protein [Acidobacteriota bacterium]